MQKKNIFFFFLLLPLFCFAKISNSPFNYDLHLTTLPGSGDRTMILFHGYGSNYKMAHFIRQYANIEATLVTFNFPDHDIFQNRHSKKINFGTIDELLPAFFVLKKQVIDRSLPAVDLYGFSAGGAAVVNVLAILNSSIYDAQLLKMGIGKEEKKKLLQAIQKGIVILDVPLKSVEEIIEMGEGSNDMLRMAKQYRENNLRPIDSLNLLKGLVLDVILHFQKKDEIIFNRDDALFIERLKKANEKGRTAVIIEDDGGHNTLHGSLWKLYSRKILED